MVNLFCVCVCVGGGNSFLSFFFFSFFLRGGGGGKNEEIMVLLAFVSLSFCKEHHSISYSLAIIEGTYPSRLLPIHVEQ